ncbi:UNKNOWN [Stylonychia lemnae]|uniref:Uncharacterized protein n=1 Tax=Stylonychia lemnae TaxID=5949 RepID=A0A078B0S0_STYLE|nr:UNKNOWN [Stylonychia lemnae]|eukprot:CDW86713.1 UNKNOWN [Stylonychia lemnae]
MEQLLQVQNPQLSQLQMTFQGGLPSQIESDLGTQNLLPLPGGSQVPDSAVTNGNLTQLLETFVQQQQLPPHQPVPDDEFRVITTESPEYKAFIKKLKENNESKQKLSVCLICWGFITFYQRRIHVQHSHYTVTPMYFKDEKSFINLAKRYDKYLEQPDGKIIVGIFAEQCQNINQSFTAGPSRGFGFGQSNESQIKRLNTIITALYEECKVKEQRITDLEEQMVQMQQLVCGQPQTAYGAFAVKPPKVQNRINISTQEHSKGKGDIGSSTQSNLAHLLDKDHVN